MVSDKSAEIFRELRARGFEEGLCKEIAYRHMNTDYTARLNEIYMYGLLDESEKTTYSKDRSENADIL